RHVHLHEPTIQELAPIVVGEGDEVLPRVLLFGRRRWHVTVHDLLVAHAPATPRRRERFTARRSVATAVARPTSPYYVPGPHRIPRSEGAFRWNIRWSSTVARSRPGSGTT